VLLFSHGKIEHKNTAKMNSGKLIENKNSMIQEEFKRINDSYVRSVKTIFQDYCFDCHSSDINPNNKYFEINKEAVKHMDMVKDFPFESHSNPENDLKAIFSTIDEKTMPPLYFEKKMSDEEIKIIKKWINKSMGLMDKSGI